MSYCDATAKHQSNHPLHETKIHIRHYSTLSSDDWLRFVRSVCPQTDMQRNPVLSTHSFRQDRYKSYLATPSFQHPCFSKLASFKSTDSHSLFSDIFGVHSFNFIHLKSCVAKPLLTCTLLWSHLWNISELLLLEHKRVQTRWCILKLFLRYWRLPIHRSVVLVLVLHWFPVTWDIPQLLRLEYECIHVGWIIFIHGHVRHVDHTRSVSAPPKLSVILSRHCCARYNEKQQCVRMFSFNFSLCIDEMERFVQNNNDNNSNSNSTATDRFVEWSTDKTDLRSPQRLFICFAARVRKIPSYASSVSARHHCS